MWISDLNRVIRPQRLKTHTHTQKLLKHHMTHLYQRELQQPIVENNTALFLFLHVEADLKRGGVYGVAKGEKLNFQMCRKMSREQAGTNLGELLDSFTEQCKLMRFNAPPLHP